MNLIDIIKQRRTIRKFDQKPIKREILQDIIDCARLAPSGKNLQPWAFLVVDREDLVKAMFQNVGWAGYIQPEGNPKPGEEPTAYVVILTDEEKSNLTEADAGAAIENLMLAALSYGIGSAWLKNVKRAEVRSLFAIGDQYTISSVVALGYPKEQNVTEPYNGHIEYYKDDEGNYHVPKFSLEEISFWNEMK